MAGEVFISYRWGNASRDAVGRLSSELKRQLGERLVRIDVEQDSEGESLRGRIERQVKAARVMIVAIHPEWIESIPRLENRDDLVRLEIEAAVEFQVPILPVLISGARAPVRDELPQSIQALADTPMRQLGDHSNYETDVKGLARSVSRLVGSKMARYVTRFADEGAWNQAFGVAILGALMLFLSRMLDIHTFRFAATVDVAVPGLKEGFKAQISREAGVLMAWNWVVVLILVTPLMVLLANATLRQAKELLDSLRIRKMIIYVGDLHGPTPASSRRLWEVVVRPTALWCQVFIVAAVILGSVQWWQYSGQWFFRERGYVQSLFMQTSTGPDWHVGWALGVDALTGSGLQITTFALLMYLVYGIGSALTFSYYAFLFNYFSELSHLSSSAGSRASVILRLDDSDQSTGGLAALARIQKGHAVFCYWSVFAMYMMALRNAYLPLTCRPLKSGLSFEQAAVEASEVCGSMGSFASMILSAPKRFLETLAHGVPDFRLLLHTYSEQNLFVMGSMLHALLIAAFFYLISTRMQSIVESARHAPDSNVGAELIRRIRFENRSVLVLLLFAALSTVFLNLGPFVVLIAVGVSLVGYWRFRSA